MLGISIIITNIFDNGSWCLRHNNMCCPPRAFRPSRNIGIFLQYPVHIPPDIFFFRFFIALIHGRELTIDHLFWCIICGICCRFVIAVEDLLLWLPTGDEENTSIGHVVIIFIGGSTTIGTSCWDTQYSLLASTYETPLPSGVLSVMVVHLILIFHCRRSIPLHELLIPYRFCLMQIMLVIND